MIYIPCDIVFLQRIALGTWKTDGCESSGKSQHSFESPRPRVIRDSVEFPVVHQQSPASLRKIGHCLEVPMDLGGKSPTITSFVNYLAAPPNERKCSSTACNRSSA